MDLRNGRENLNSTQCVLDLVQQFAYHNVEQYTMDYGDPEVSCNLQRRCTRNMFAKHLCAPQISSLHTLLPDNFRLEFRLM
jgi:hypothetical protein